MGVITYEGRDDFRLIGNAEAGEPWDSLQDGVAPLSRELQVQLLPPTTLYSRSVVLSLEAVLIGGGVVRKTLVS